MLPTRTSIAVTLRCGRWEFGRCCSGRMAWVSDQKERMLRGALYQDSDPALVAERRRCQSLLDKFNTTTSEQEEVRQAILTELLGGIGGGSWVMPRFQCDYGYLIWLGRNSF